MLRAFLKTCRAVQLLHVCVVKSKVSGTVARVSWFNHTRVLIIIITYVRILQLDCVLSRLYFCCINKIVGLYKMPRNELLAASRCLQPSGM